MGGEMSMKLLYISMIQTSQGLVRVGTDINTSPPSSQEGEGRRADNFIEDAGSPDKQDETNDLEPLEGFPPEAKAEQPNEESPASIDGASSSRRYAPGHTQPEKIESAV